MAIVGKETIDDVEIEEDGKNELFLQKVSRDQIWY